VRDEAKDALAEVGFDPLFGARPLKRAIQRHLEDPLARRLLAGEFSAGTTIVASAKDNEITLEAARAAAA
jgi:ATP-dependent Clp protease ATP-binding subunit ClpA